MSSANDGKGSSVWYNMYSNFKENSENFPKNSSGQSPFNMNINQTRGTFHNNGSNQHSQQSGWLSTYNQEKKFQPENKIIKSANKIHEEKDMRSQRVIVE